MKQQYIPKPLDTSSVQLSAELLELTDLLAKNTHEVWSSQRLAEGWKYGKERDDERKEYPCLAPCEELPESEKEYYRNTAIETLKLIVRLGFEIEK